MSLARALPLLLLLALAGCGFQPLYGSPTASSGPAAMPQMQQVAVPPIPERGGQILRIELQNRLNPQGSPAKPRWRLDISYREIRSDVAILRDATATFAKYVGDARWVLVDLDSNAPADRGRARRTASFPIADSEFATLQAERDAQRRVATELAEDIRLRLGLYFQRAGG